MISFMCEESFKRGKKGASRSINVLMDTCVMLLVYLDDLFGAIPKRAFAYPRVCISMSSNQEGFALLC